MLENDKGRVKKKKESTTELHGQHTGTTKILEQHITSSSKPCPSLLESTT